MRPEPVEVSIADPVERFLLRRWQNFTGPLDVYRWPWEKARWHELVFCLLLRAGRPRLEPEAARKIVDVLASLDMLQVESLAQCLSPDGNLDPSAADLEVMRALLERAGVDSSKGRAAIKALCEMAEALSRGFDGRVQRYLRLYAERMLSELGTHFPVTALSPEDLRHVFTHWLQNVADLPIGRSGPELDRMAANLGVKPDDVVRSADRLDLNLALLDDILDDDAGGAGEAWATEVADVRPEALQKST